MVKNMLNETQLNGIRYGESYLFGSNNAAGSYLEISKTFRKTNQRDFFEPDQPEDFPEEVVKKGRIPIDITFSRDEKKGQGTNFLFEIEQTKVWQTIVSSMVLHDKISVVISLDIPMGPLPKSLLGVVIYVRLDHQRAEGVKRFVQAPPRTFILEAMAIKDVEQAFGPIAWDEPEEATQAAE